MGGAEVFTREVAKRWVELGHEVSLFTSEFPGCKRQESLNGVRIVRRGGRLAVYWWAKRAYKKYFSKEGFDVVIDEINTRPFFMPSVVKNNAKTIALIHQLAREYWFYETPFPVSHIGYYLLENQWLKQYVEVPTVTVSESTRRDLLDLGFRRVFVVPEGLNFRPLRRVPLKAEHPVAVFVGRLKRAKRPDNAVQAFKTVREMIPDAELWVIGDGDFKGGLERMAGDGVRFFGGLSNVERRELIERAWVLVNPSVREGWGLNVVEANALGTPCVAYNVAGLRDSVKNGETGLLAEAGSIDDLSDKLVMLLKDDVLMKRLGRRASDYSRQFSWDDSAEAFLKVIQCVGL
jgi:glycosyltransferase involved in cell wall biosynthesis